MGELNEVVVALLEAFSGGLAIIKTLRHRRKEAKAKIDTATQSEELRLRRSLKKNREDVRSVYSKDLEKLGSKFAEGDVKSRSSLASILFRLNTGLVGIIDRFTQGKSTHSDYVTLVKLSNASRIEAINTFGQLSARLSQPSLSEGSGRQKRKRSKTVKDSSKPASVNSSSIELANPTSETRSKSPPELSNKKSKVASSGTSRSSRPKTKRKSSTTSTKSQSSGSITPQDAAKSTPKRDRSKTESHRVPRETSPLSVSRRTNTQTPISPSKSRDHKPRSPHRRKNRQSLMSFASDSTKMGEIPEHKWVRTAQLKTGEPNPLEGTAYPLAPWRAPEKPRSRFKKFFNR